MMTRIANETSSSFSNGPEDPSLKSMRQIEAHFARVRWAAALLWITLLPLIPTVSRPLMVAVAVVFTFGSAATWHLLLKASDKNGLQFVQRVTTVVTWTCATGAVTLSADAAATILPAVYLILIVVSAVRYRRLGAIGASICAIVLTTASFTTHVWLYRSSIDSEAILFLLFWIVLISLMGSLSYIVVRASDEARQQRANELAKYRRERLGLTAREWEVLDLLVQGFTYAQIATQLHISPRTVESHVTNVGTKLDTPGGRKPIERRVKELELFAEAETNSD